MQLLVRKVNFPPAGDFPFGGEVVKVPLWPAEVNQWYLVSGLRCGIVTVFVKSVSSVRTGIVSTKCASNFPGASICCQMLTGYFSLSGSRKNSFAELGPT